jgi:hypothetical protein
MLQLSTLPANKVLTDSDMRMIVKVCKIFSSTANHEPICEEISEDRLLLDIHFGYKFVVTREERTVQRVRKSLRGSHTEPAVVHGYRAVLADEFERAIHDSWSEDAEGMIAAMFEFMTRHTASNVAIEVAQYKAYCSEKGVLPHEGD